MYYIENTLNKLSMKYVLIYSFKKTQPPICLFLLVALALGDISKKMLRVKEFTAYVFV